MADTRRACKYAQYGCVATFAADDAAGMDAHEADQWRSHTSLLEYAVDALTAERQRNAIALRGATERCAHAEREETKARHENARLVEVIRQLQLQTPGHTTTTVTTSTTTTTGAAGAPSAPTPGAAAKKPVAAAIKQSVVVPSKASGGAAALGHSSMSPAAEAITASPPLRAIQNASVLLQQYGLPASATGMSVVNPTLRTPTDPTASATTAAAAAAAGVGEWPFQIFGGAHALGLPIGAAGAGPASTATPVSGAGVDATRLLQQSRIRKLTRGIALLQSQLRDTESELSTFKGTATGTGAAGADTGSALKARNAAKPSHGHARGLGGGQPFSAAPTPLTLKADSLHFASAKPLGLGGLAGPSAITTGLEATVPGVVARKKGRGKGGAGGSAAASSLGRLQKIPSESKASAFSGAATAVTGVVDPKTGASFAHLTRLERDDMVLYVYKDHGSAFSGPRGEYVDGDELKCHGFVMFPRDDEPQVLSHMSVAVGGGAPTDSDSGSDDGHDARVRQAFEQLHTTNYGISSYELEQHTAQVQRVSESARTKPFVQRAFCGKEWIDYFRGAGARVSSANAKANAKSASTHDRERGSDDY